MAFLMTLDMTSPRLTMLQRWAKFSNVLVH